jgi:short-subunit dehydrogenase
MTISRDSVAVITGAASGIGRALAERFAREKVAGIAIADLNREGLNETHSLVAKHGVECSQHLLDVSSKDAMREFSGAVIAAHGRATHLINNAGVGLLGSFEQISLEDFEWLMGINFWGVVYGCEYFLPILKEQPVAHIVNISSVFGLIAPPEQTAYAASKFAVRGFTEALRHELEGANVRVSSVHPGGIKTNIVRSSRLGAGTPKKNSAQAAKFFDKVAQTSPETAADVIVRGIQRNNPRILIGADAHAISYVHRLFPKSYLKVFERLAGHRLDLRKKSG